MIEHDFHFESSCDCRWMARSNHEVCILPTLGGEKSSEFWVFSRLNQFSPIFLWFPRDLSKWVMKNWQKIWNFEPSGEKFQWICQFWVTHWDKSSGNHKNMGEADLNKRKLNFHCEFAPNVGHLFFAFYKFFEILAKTHPYFIYKSPKYPRTYISIRSYIGKGATCGTGGPRFNSPLGRVKAAKIS